jgi:hypothetical protein
MKICLCYKIIHRTTGYEILMAVNIKIMVFRNVTSYSPVDRYQYFGGASRLQIHDRPSSTLKTNAGTYVLD